MSIWRFLRNAGRPSRARANCTMMNIAKRTPSLSVRTTWRLLWRRRRFHSERAACTEVQGIGRVVRLALAVALLAVLAGCGTTNPSPAAPTEAATPSEPSGSTPIPVAPDDPTWGSPHAPVTIVAFLDLECPFCARGYTTLRALQEEYGPDVLRVVYKHAPLPFHRRGMPAAIAAQAVHTERGTEAFSSYVGLVFSDPARLAPGRLQETAVEMGVPRERLAILLGDPGVVAAVNADLELAESLGVNGVPAFFINGARLEGAMPVEDFRALIEHERAAAQALRQSGVDAAGVYAARVNVNLKASSEALAEDVEPPYVVPVGQSPSLGSSDAWVTIVEFADFECPYCRDIHPVIAELLAQNPGKVRWVMKHNPLDFHQLAVPAAILALEIRQQRGDAAYWEALDTLFQTPRITQPLLLELASHYELEPAAYARSLKLAEQHPQLQADRDLAMDLQAQGTPHFFVNGRRVVGAQPKQHFQTLLEEEFAKVEQLSRANPNVAAYQLVQQSASPPPGLVRVTIDAPDTSAPTQGPADAPVVVQMFSDFECGYCRRVLPTLDELRRRYPGQVRVVWRHLPLAFHPHARLAANAAMEVRAQRGDQAFWQMTDRLFGVNGHEPERLSREVLVRHAHALGVEPESFQHALEARSHDASIQRDLELAARLGISGTPSFVIDGYRLIGAQPLSRFERLVRLSLAEKARAGAAEVDAEPAPRKL